MENKKILITGGCGFVGSNIVNELLKNKTIKVIVLDNLFSGFEDNIKHHYNNPNFEFIKGDIRDYELLKKITKDVDIICHQAAWGSVPRSLLIPREYHNNNVSGFFNILESARENNIKRVIYASSSSVYGDEEQLPKVEDKIGNALSPYAATKQIDEIYAQIYYRCYGIQTIGFRYFNVFGPNQNPEGCYAAVIPKFINNILNNEIIKINGDGSFSRDFTYIDNVVQININAMFTNNSESFGKVYNVGFGEKNTLNDLVNILKKYFTDIKVEYKDNREGDIPHSLASIQKVEKLLNYKKNVSFQEGIKKTIIFYIKKNSKKIKNINICQNLMSELLV